MMRVRFPLPAPRCADIAQLVERTLGKGEGLIFYGPEEALIAYNEGKVDIHAIISVVTNDLDENGNIVKKMIKETSVGRIIVNELVPDECGYLNTIISKKSLRDIISDVIKTVGVARACRLIRRLSSARNR